MKVEIFTDNMAVQDDINNFIDTDKRKVVHVKIIPGYEEGGSYYNATILIFYEESQ